MKTLGMLFMESLHGMRTVVMVAMTGGAVFSLLDGSTKVLVTTAGILLMAIVGHMLGMDHALDCVHSGRIVVDTEDEDV